MKLHIGSSIKRLRSEKDVTQEELADYLGISYQAVSRWENLQCYPDIEMLPEIAHFFDCSLDELMGINRNREKIAHVVSKASEVQFLDSESALASLRALEKEFPKDWKVKSGICSALSEGANYRALMQGDTQAYDAITPEMRKYGWEARMNFDSEEFGNVQWLYRSLILTAPEDEVEEWVDQIVSNPYNTKEANMLLRYTDFRRDAEKARYWQGRVIRLYTQCLASQFRNPDGSSEGWGEVHRMTLRLYDAVAGAPYEENGFVHNTWLLCERVEQSLSLIAVEAEFLEREVQTAEALERCVRDLSLYIASENQDGLTVDNLNFALASETAPKKQRELLDALMRLVGTFPDAFKESAWYQKNLDRLRSLAVEK